MLAWIIIGIFALIGMLVTAAGGFFLFKKITYDTAVTATVSNVRCQEGTNKCNITLTFKDTEDIEITRNAIVAGPITDGSTRGILYDSSNPSNVYPGQPPVRTMGAGLFIGGIVFLVACAGAAYLYWRRSVASLEPYPEPVQKIDKSFEPTKFESPQLFPSKSKTTTDTMTYDESSSPKVDSAKSYAADMVDKMTSVTRLPPLPK